MNQKNAHPKTHVHKMLLQVGVAKVTTLETHHFLITFYKMGHITHFTKMDHAKY